MRKAAMLSCLPSRFALISFFSPEPEHEKPKQIWWYRYQGFGDGVWALRVRAFTLNHSPKPKTHKPQNLNEAIF